MVVLVGGLLVGLTAVEHPLNLLFLLLLLAVVRTLNARAWATAGFVLGLIVAPPTPVPLSDKIHLRGPATVASVPTLYKDGSTFTLDFRGRRFHAVAIDRTPFVLGEALRISADAKPPAAGFERSYAIQGVVGEAVLKPGSVKVVQAAPWTNRMAEAWRRSFLDFLAKALPPQGAALVGALCFNVDSLLDQDVHDALVDSGTVHLVSASGLHVMVLAVLFQFLAGTLPIRRGWQLGLVAAGLAFYCLACGLQPSILRASFVMLVGLGAYLFRREADFPSSLGFAALAILLWQPWALYSVGFQLSFCVVAAMGLFGAGRAPARLSPLARNAWFGARMAAIATVASVPLVAYYFGVVPLLGVLANLVVAGVVPVAIVLALAGYAISFVAFPLGANVALLAGDLSGWILAVADRLSAPWSLVPTPIFSGYWLALFYLGGLLAVRRRVVPA